MLWARCRIFPYGIMAYSLFCTIPTAKDCKCKCGDKKDMEDTCVKGKWDGKPIENIIVSNWCMYDCWKCRMQGSLQTCWLQEILKHPKSRVGLLKFRNIKVFIWNDLHSSNIMRFMFRLIFYLPSRHWQNLQLGRLKSTEKLSSVNLHWYILQWYWNVMNNL